MVFPSGISLFSFIILIFLKKIKKIQKIKKYIHNIFVSKTL